MDTNPVTQRKDSYTKTHDRILEKLGAARASFEDDAKGDHEALGLVLEILEHHEGVDEDAQPKAPDAPPVPVVNVEVESSPPTPVAPQAP